MEQAAFLFGVVGEAVRELVVVGEVHHDVGPFAAFDAVHGGERHPGRVAAHGEVAAQPALEAAGVVVQAGELGQRGEVVVLGRAVHAVAVVVERGDGAAEADAVDEGVDHVGGGGATGDQRLQPFDVGGELGDPGGIAVVGEPFGEALEGVDAALLGDPVGDARVQRA